MYKIFFVFPKSPSVDGSALFFKASRMSHFAITAPRFRHPVTARNAAVPVFLA
jgi:hypothetical protein